jgi:hypothetical protein
MSLTVERKGEFFNPGALGSTYSTTTEESLACPRGPCAQARARL